MPPLLSIVEVAVRFRGIVALDGISFDLAHGSIVGLIGPNGAGKTTLFNCLSRLYAPNSGDILFEGNSILDMPAHGIARIGIGRTFQNLAMFASLSVLDNVKIGAHASVRGNYVADALSLPGSKRVDAALNRTADKIIDELDLHEVAKRRVGDLPFGTQKRVDIGRALAMKPKLLLLDEPACGLNHEEVDELGRLIRHIRDVRATSVLLVEHHMSLVMSISDKVVALNFGRKLAEGTPDEVRCDPGVIDAYLGAGSA